MNLYIDESKSVSSIISDIRSSSEYYLIAIPDCIWEEMVSYQMTDGGDCEYCTATVVKKYRANIGKHTSRILIISHDMLLAYGNEFNSKKTKRILIVLEPEKLFCSNIQIWTSTEYGIRFNEMISGGTDDEIKLRLSDYARHHRAGCATFSHGTHKMILNKLFNDQFVYKTWIDDSGDYEKYYFEYNHILDKNILKNFKNIHVYYKYENESIGDELIKYFKLSNLWSAQYSYAPVRIFD